MLIGELPFFSNSTDDTDPGIDDSRTERWGYAFRPIERPAVAVRELVAEEGLTAT